jgi:plastocyanin
MSAITTRRLGCTLMIMGALCGIGRTTIAADASSSKDTKTFQIEIRNFAFAPKTLTVPVGARVVWTNHDEEPHVVTSAGSMFASSKALDTSDSYTVTFSKSGTYTYYCSIHPMMVGSIIVQ